MGWRIAPVAEPGSQTTPKQIGDTISPIIGLWPVFGRYRCCKEVYSAGTMFHI
jgi:hypothetical protein